MKSKKLLRMASVVFCLTVILAIAASCATTITPEIEETFDWSQVKKVCVVGVSDLERSRVIGKALAHHLFEDGVPVVTRETDSVVDIYDVAHEANAEVVVYGVVTKVEITRSTTVYPPTTLKEIVLELQFIDTASKERIWKGSGSKADSANVKDDFLISALVGQMAHEVVPHWTELPRGSIGVPMLEIGADAPRFEVTDIDGNRYALEDQIGKKVVVLTFWSFFCEPCKRTLSILNDIHRRYRPRGVNVVAVSLEGEPMLSRIKSRVYQDKLEFTFLLDEPEGDSFEVADPYLVPGTPTLYVIDKAGKIVFARAGKVSTADLTAVVEAELAKQ
jgi:peroxiredoxin/predicted secreted protein